MRCIFLIYGFNFRPFSDENKIWLRLTNKGSDDDEHDDDMVLNNFSHY